MALDLARPTAIPTSISSSDSSSQSRQPTPLSSAASTPDTISPTSTNQESLSPPNQYSQYPRRQIRPQKQPLYIPAALRPSESPAYWRAVQQGRSNLAAGLAATKHLPSSGIPTPPHSTSNSFNEDDEDSRAALKQQQLLGDAVVGGKISRVVTEEWKESRVEDVTGSPTREHWKPDSHSTICESARCHAQFSLVTRRHHCRRCGKIFCSQHSAHAVPLDQHATFHARGELGRACDSCWADYRHWERMRQSRTNSTSGSECGSGTATPVDATSSSTATTPKDGQTTAFGSFCSRDWSWSTF